MSIYTRNYPRSAKLKVLRVIPSMNPVFGGPCQGIRNSVPCMEKMGVHTEVVCMDDPSESFLEKDEFTIHALGKSKGVWKYNKRLLPWLVANLQRFDAVIIHGLWIYHSYAVHKAITIVKRKPQPVYVPRVFVMPHGMLDPWFQLAAGRKIKAVRNNFYWSLIEKKIVNDSDAVLFTSDEELKLARKTFRSYRPRKELNAGYGISTPPVFTRSMRETFLENYPRLAGKNYMLYLSRLDVKKGVDVLIRAYKKYKEEHPQFASLVIAGPGLDTPFGKQLQDLAKGNDDIIFTGMLTGNSKWAAIYDCEAFILPSHQENFGIAVVEALACNKPVLISRQVNIWNEIIEAGAGFADDVSEEGITRLLRNWDETDGEGKKAMNEHAGLLFNTKYTAESAAKKMLEVMNNVR